jgi:hypothetical protein
MGGLPIQGPPFPSPLPPSEEEFWVEWDDGWYYGRVAESRSMIDPLGSWEVFEFKVNYEDGDVKLHMTEETCFRVKRRVRQAGWTGG